MNEFYHSVWMKKKPGIVIKLSNLITRVNFLGFIYPPSSSEKINSSSFAAITSTSIDHEVGTKMIIITKKAHLNQID
ncbi:hypothetical protein DERF_007784 [Dermatophagoides farinae]|uniref:Uncharacterized protein n=1 Tax=Dermatophagoides farinae TaxID=6954 RepID=A0A922I471_DERFA|nr:hypothetical protein DERF_007784 [Dermatophagoides farinae]